MELKHESQFPVAEMRRLLRRQRGKIAPLEEHGAAGGAVERAENMQQRRLARTGRSHDGQRLAGLHLEADVAQNGQFAGRAFHGLARMAHEIEGTVRRIHGSENVVTHSEGPRQARDGPPAWRDKWWPRNTEAWTPLRWSEDPEDR